MSDTKVAKIATPRQVRAQVQDMDEAFLACKAYGHNWNPLTVEKTGSVYTQTLKCSRCTSECVQDINRRGQLVSSRRYSYPDGYLFQGLGRVMGDARGVIRVAVLTNTLARMPHDLEATGTG